MIVGRKEARFVEYSLAGHEVVRLINVLGKAGQTYPAEIDRLVRL